MKLRFIELKRDFVVWGLARSPSLTDFSPERAGGWGRQHTSCEPGDTHVSGLRWRIVSGCCSL